jgi:hypothetical protein
MQDFVASACLCGQLGKNRHITHLPLNPALDCRGLITSKTAHLAANSARSLPDRSAKERTRQHKTRWSKLLSTRKFNEMSKMKTRPD